MSEVNETQTQEPQQVVWPTYKGRFAHTSRGKHWAKHVETGAWAKDADGVSYSRDPLVLDRPGAWLCGSSDGFQRKDKWKIVVTSNGDIERQVKA